MVRFATARVAPFNARQSWKVSAAEVGPAGLHGSAAVLSRAVSAASCVTGAPDFVAVSIEAFEVLRPVVTGDDLIIMAAREGSADGHVAVSVVVRSHARSAGVVALGVVRFALPSVHPSTALPHHETHGATVISTFASDVEGQTLHSDSLLARLQATALVSAQGFVGRLLTFERVRGLSVLGPARAGTRLRLQCSVVQTEGARVHVFSHLTQEATGTDVLCALTTFRAVNLVPRLERVPSLGRA